MGLSHQTDDRILFDVAMLKSPSQRCSSVVQMQFNKWLHLLQYLELLYIFTEENCTFITF